MIKSKNPPKILSDVFPDWFSGTGIFQALSAPPWASLNIDPDTLDIEYFGNISGDKLSAPLVHKLLTDDGVLDNTGIATLAAIIKNRFYQKWTKLFNTYYITYDPLRNYNITETGEEIVTGTDSKETTSSSDNTETLNTTDQVTYATQDQLTLNTNDLVTHATQDQLTLDTVDATTRQNTEQLTQSVNSSRSDTRYGFNSVDAVPTDGSSGTETTTGTDTNNGTDSTLRTGTETTAHTGTVTDAKTGTETTAKTGTDTTTHTGTVKDLTLGAGTEEGEHEQTREYSHTRTGLNGLRTIQEIIEQDRALWMVDYFAIVYADVNTVLANPVYPSRRGLNYPWVNWGFSNN